MATTPAAPRRCSLRLDAVLALSTALVVLATACGDATSIDQDDAQAERSSQTIESVDADGAQDSPTDTDGSDAAAAATGPAGPSTNEPGAVALSPAQQSRAIGQILAGVAAIDQYRSGTLVAHAVDDTVVAHTSPSVEAEPVDTFINPTESGGPLVFQAVGSVTDDGWLEVLLPVRPNGTTGWIQAEQVSLSVNPYRIHVDVSRFELTISRYGVEQLSTEVAIGVGETPTPIGDFYLIELLRPSNPNGAYGPFAYGLSGFSDTLESFNGGEGVIGIHGTDQPDLIGQEVSHGCIRVPNETITTIVEFLPLGTPVSIFASDAGTTDAGPTNAAPTEGILELDSDLDRDGDVDPIDGF